MVVDTREPADLKKFAISFGCVARALDSADIALLKGDENVAGAERKRVADFVGSMIKEPGQKISRLDSQVSRMIRQYPIRILLLTGSLSAFARVVAKQKRHLNMHAILGRMSSLICREGFHLIMADNDIRGYELIIRLFQKIAQEKYGVPSIPSKTQFQLIMTLPGVDKGTSKSLLKHFGNVESIMSASKKDLKAVKGIGDKRAQQIYEFIRKDVTI